MRRSRKRLFCVVIIVFLAAIILTIQSYYKNLNGRLKILMPIIEKEDFVFDQNSVMPISVNFLDVSVEKKEKTEYYKSDKILVKDTQILYVVKENNMYKIVSHNIDTNREKVLFKTKNVINWILPINDDQILFEEQNKEILDDIENNLRILKTTNNEIKNFYETYNIKNKKLYNFSYTDNTLYFVEHLIDIGINKFNLNELSINTGEIINSNKNIDYYSIDGNSLYVLEQNKNSFSLSSNGHKIVDFIPEMGLEDIFLGDFSVKDEHVIIKIKIGNNEYILLGNLIQKSYVTFNVDGLDTIKEVDIGFIYEKKVVYEHYQSAFTESMPFLLDFDGELIYEFEKFDIKMEAVKNIPSVLYENKLYYLVETNEDIELKYMTMK